jgi:hypothetical protein
MNEIRVKPEIKVSETQLDNNKDTMDFLYMCADFAHTPCYITNISKQENGLILNHDVNSFSNINVTMKTKKRMAQRIEQRIAFLIQNIPYDEYQQAIPEKQEEDKPKKIRFIEPESKNYKIHIDHPLGIVKMNLIFKKNGVKAFFKTSSQELLDLIQKTQKEIEDILCDYNVESIFFMKEELV